jgi:hypothetical protein
MGQRTNLPKLAAALVGVPVAFGAFVLVSYKMKALPFLSSGEWLWYAAFACCLILGVRPVYLAVKSPRLKLLACGLYVVLMGFLLGAVAFQAACLMGDCL